MTRSPVLCAAPEGRAGRQLSRCRGRGRSRLRGCPITRRHGIIDCMEWEPVYTAVTWLRNNWAKVRPWITPLALASETKPIPKKTFRIVLDTSVPPWWHMGKMGDEPATQIHARYYVTNITGEKMLVVGCKLKPEGTDQTYDLQHSARQMLSTACRNPTGGIPRRFRSQLSPRAFLNW